MLQINHRKWLRLIKDFFEAELVATEPAKLVLRPIKILRPIVMGRERYSSHKHFLEA